MNELMIKWQYYHGQEQDSFNNEDVGMIFTLFLLVYDNGLSACFSIQEYRITCPVDMW